MRDVLFAASLAAAGLLLSLGAARFHDGAGLIVGGLVLAVWSWLVLGEVSDQ